MRAKKRRKPNIITFLAKDNQLALGGESSNGEKRATLRDGLRLPLKIRHMETALIAVIALAGISAYNSTAPIREELHNKTVNLLTPIITSQIAQVDIQATPILRTGAPGAALLNLGPASAIDLAMQELTRLPKDHNIITMTAEALVARHSPEAAAAFLTKYEFSTAAEPSAPKMSTHWKGPFEKLVKSLTPEGTTTAEEIEKFYIETVVADQGEKQARSMLTSMGDKPSTPSGQNLIDTIRTAQGLEWTNRFCQTPLEFQEIALAGLRHRLQGSNPEWIETDSVKDFPEPPISSSSKPITNEGEPTKDIVVLGEEHDQANSSDYKDVIDTLHKKGFHHLTLELPSQSIVTGFKMCETRDYALSKGWTVDQVDMNIPQQKSRAEEAATIQNWSRNARGDTKIILEALAKKTAGDTAALRSQYMGFGITKTAGGTLHIGGSAHTSEIQDAVASITGKRPLGIEINYGTVGHQALQAVGRDASASKNSILSKPADLADLLNTIIPKAEHQKEKEALNKTNIEGKIKQAPLDKTRSNKLTQGPTL